MTTLSPAKGESDARDEDRRVDEGPKIHDHAWPRGGRHQPTLAPPVPRKTAIPAAPAAQRRGGLGLVIVLYLCLPQRAPT